MTTLAASTPEGRYHHGDLRSVLLAVTRDLLREVGPEEVSLREAARRAGVSSRAPYRHFPSKDALLSALAANGFDELCAVLHAAAQAAPAGRQVQDQAVAYVRFAQGEPALYRLMFSYRMVDADPALARAKASTLALLAAAAATGAPAGADVAARATACWAR